MQDIAQEMNKLELGVRYTRMLTEMMKLLNEIDVDKYGMKEDADYETPTFVARGTIDISNKKRTTQRTDIKKDIEQMKKTMKRLNRRIDTNQKSNYQHALLKRRHDECETYAKDSKKQRTESKRAQNALNKTHHARSTPAFADLVDNSEDDEFDLS